MKRRGKRGRHWQSSYLSQPHNRRWCTFFQAGVLFSIENANFWHILANFVVNLRTFWRNSTIPNSVVVYHLQISDVPPTNPKALLGRIQKPKSLLIVRRTRTILCFQGGLRAKLRALVHHLSIGARCSSKGLIITTLVNEINKKFAE